MSNDLMEYVAAAVESGAIPGPVDGESLDSYRMRTAHAGAVVGAKWITDRNAAFAAEQEALVREKVAAAEHSDYDEDARHRIPADDPALNDEAPSPAEV